MSRLALHLLGPPRIERDGTAVQVHRRKAVALLAYLAVTGSSHSREALATLLWPESSQSRALAGLRVALAALNDALGAGWLAVDREMAGVAPDAGSSTALPSTVLATGPATGDLADSAGTSGQVLWLDVRAFRGCLAACRTHGHPSEEACPACLPPLAEAVALYRDDFLAGFTLPDSPAFDEWQFFQAEGLRQELASALERLVRGHSAQGAYEPAILYARRWLALDPLHEPAHRCLMRLYAGSGQRAAALRQYAECERVLREELGTSPEKETAQLYEAIQARRDVFPPLAPPMERSAARAALAAPQIPARRHNLPVQLTPFLGREALLAEVAKRLQDPACRLLSLVGPGGSGKTRLALEAAAAQLDNYAHGVYFVPLAPLAAPEAIVPAVATALGFSFYAEAAGGEQERAQQRSPPKEQLLEYLRQKNVLLVMDNFEHLSDGAVLMTEMLKAAPGIKILATSRARLSVQGEHLLPVSGMDVPPLSSPISGRGAGSEGTAQSVCYAQDTSRSTHSVRDAAQYSAVQLFVQNARRALPGFELTDDNLAGVVEICHLVDGLPLGILLAAAWVGMLKPGEIAAEIQESLDFLEVGLYDIPARQHSMRAVFDHSWNLLSEREQAVMQALSVFRGGFTQQAARRVAGATLHELRALMEKSLLQRDRAPGGRYNLHELLRQYAAEKLDQSPTVRRAAQERHSAYYTAALQQWDVDLKGPRQQAALAEIEADSENARVAWSWAVECGQVEWLDRAMGGLCRSYEWRGRYQEGEAACRTAAEKLKRAGPDRELRVLARNLAWQSAFSRLLGRTEHARRLLEQSLSLLAGPEPTGQEPSLGRDARPERAFVLLQMGRTLEYTDREEARQWYEQSLALYRALGDLWGTASVLNLLGYANRLLGDYDKAKQLSQESLAIRRALGDHSGVADSLLELGWSAVLQGQLAEGERLIGESLAIRRETGGRAGVAEVLLRLGVALFWRGRFAEAHSLIEESVAAYDELGERRSLAWANVVLGLPKAHLGQYQDAHAHAQKGLALYREIDERSGVGHALLVLGHVALAREAYTEAQQWLKECVAVYRGVEVQDELAWALADLAVAAQRLDDPGRARRYLCAALQMSTVVPGSLLLWVTLPASALLLIGQGEVERAVELYALTLHRFPAANARWFEDVFGRRITAAAAEALPPDAVAAAQERGRARDLEATARELLTSLEEGAAAEG